MARNIRRLIACCSIAVFASLLTTTASAVTQKNGAAIHAKGGKAVKAAKASKKPKHSRATSTAIVAGLAATTAVSATAQSSRAPSAPGTRDTAESMLNEVLEEIGRQRFDAALQGIDNLIRIHPNFRLAHLIKGDLLLARTRPLGEMGAAPKAPADRIDDLREEAIARLRGYRDRPSPAMVPRYVMQLSAEQQFAIVVDTTRSRLYLYSNDNGRPQLVSDFYISSGKNGSQKMREGDLRTPIGVYHVTSSLSAKKLPDLYGSGAFPINYPNTWDRRMGRNGHGIWLHGTPSDTFSRPPRASDGCVVLSNDDLDRLSKYLQIGLTPVIISEQVEWVSADGWASERQSFLNALEQWRTDWESRDTERYLQNYSRKVDVMGQDFDTFARGKRQVNSSKEWIKLKINNVSAFRNPGREDLVTVTFEQDYRSSNLSNVMKKRQYWSREGNRWRIVYEGAA